MHLWDFPGCPVVKAVLPIQRLQVPSLVGKLGPHMLCSQNKRKICATELDFKGSGEETLLAKRVENSLGNSLKDSWEITGKTRLPVQNPGEVGWCGHDGLHPRGLPCLTGGSRRDPRPQGTWELSFGKIISLGGELGNGGGSKPGSQSILG